MRRGEPDVDRFLFLSLVNLVHMHFSTQFEPTRHVVYRVTRSSHTNRWVNPIAALSLQDLCLQILRTTLQRTRENNVSTVYSCCNKPNEASNKKSEAARHVTFGSLACSTIKKTFLIIPISKTPKAPARTCASEIM